MNFCSPANIEVDAPVTSRTILRCIGGVNELFARPAARCTFSESLEGQTLGMGAGSPPGQGGFPAAATRTWRAVAHVLRSPVTLARTVSNDLLTTLVPADCRICRQPLLHASGLPVCSACLDGLSPREDHGCLRCGDRLDLAGDMEDLSFRGMECMPCRLVPPEFERAVSFGTYEDELREMIHLFKYERMRSLARVLGTRLAQAIAPLQGQAGTKLVVIAVPLFARAERIRGYNQAQLLADEAVRALRKTHPSWSFHPEHAALARKRETAPQFALPQRARRRNLSGAFVVPTAGIAAVKDREILLIDDIYTTGATARECARVLRRAGAARVWVATVARACGADSARHTQLQDSVARWGEPTH